MANKKIFSNFLSNLLGCFLAPGSRKTRIKKKCQNLGKMADFVKKIAEIRDVKLTKPFHYQ